MKQDYHSFCSRVRHCVEQWLDSRQTDFEFPVQYLWVHEIDGELDITICDTDSPCDGMTVISKFTDIDYVTFEESVNDDAIHAMARDWCFEPTAAQSRNYTIPEIVTEDNIAELCERFRDIIAEGDLRGAPEINVRYAVRDSMFHVASFGDYFFFGDIMYVVDKDKKWASYHDEFAAKAFFGEKHMKRGYVHAVAFCGIQVPFKDENGDAVFTGDICKCYDDIYRVVTASKYEGYGFKGDNCMTLLENYQESLHRVGTIFYELSLDEPLKNTWEHSSDIWSSWGQAEDIGVKLAKARITPSFMHGELDYFVISHINEEYDWRLIFDRSEACPPKMK